MQNTSALSLPGSRSRSVRYLPTVEKSQDDLNDESLFGSLNTYRNLLDKGNIALGSNLNNTANIDKDNIVFHDASQGSDDEPEIPGNTTISLVLEQTQATH